MQPSVAECTASAASDARVRSTLADYGLQPSGGHQLQLFDTYAIRVEGIQRGSIGKTSGRAARLISDLWRAKDMWLAHSCVLYRKATGKSGMKLELPQDVHSGFRRFVLPRDVRGDERQSQVQVKRIGCAVTLVNASEELTIVANSDTDGREVERQVLARLVPWSLLVEAGHSGAAGCLTTAPFSVGGAAKFPRQLDGIIAEFCKAADVEHHATSIIDVAKFAVDNEPIKDALFQASPAIGLLVGVVGFGLHVYRSFRCLNDFGDVTAQLRDFYLEFDDVFRQAILEEGRQNCFVDDHVLSFFDKAVASVEEVTGHLLHVAGSRTVRLTVSADAIKQTILSCRARLQIVENSISRRRESAIARDLRNLQTRKSPMESFDLRSPRRALKRRTIGHPDHVDRTVENQLVSELTKLVGRDGPELVRVCLWGMPQSGKSTLSYNVAQRLAEYFPDQVVLEMDGYSEYRGARSVKLAVTDYMQSCHEGVTVHNSLARFWATFPAAYNSVVVIEDVTDTQLEDIFNDFHFRFPAKALVILTTRDVSVRRKANAAGYLTDWNVNLFEDEEGFGLFEAVRAAKRARPTQAQVRSLVDSNNLLQFFPSIGWVKHVAQLLMECGNLTDMRETVKDLTRLHASRPRDDGYPAMDPEEIVTWTLGRMRNLRKGTEIAALQLTVVFRGSFDTKTFQKASGLESYVTARKQLAALEEWGFLIQQCPQQVYDPEAGEVKDNQTRWWMHPELRLVTESVLKGDTVVAGGESRRRRNVADSLLDLAGALTEETTSARTRAQGFALDRDNIAFALNLVGTKFFSQDRSRFWRLYTENVVWYCELEAVLRREMKELGASGEPADGDSRAWLGRCLVALLRGRDDYAAALRLGEELRAHWAEQGRAESQDCANLDTEIGIAMCGLDRDGEALARFEKAVDVYRKLNLGDLDNCASAIQGSGAALNGLGLYGEALKRLEEADGVYRKRGLGDLTNYANALQESGKALHGLSRFREALERFEHAIEVCQEHGLGDSVYCADAIRWSGDALHDLDRYLEALTQFEKAVRVYRKLGLGTSIKCAKAIRGSGEALHALARYGEALAHFEEAVHVYRKLELGDSASCATVIERSGSSLNGLGRFDEALARFVEVDTIFRKLELGESVNCAKAMQRSGAALHEMSEYRDAVARFEGAVGVYRKLGLGDSVNCAKALKAGGDALSGLNRYDDALARFEAAVDIYRKLGLGESVNCANTIVRCGDSLRELGRCQEALRNYNAGIAIYSNPNLVKSENIAIAVGQKGALFIRMGQTQAGVQGLQRAIETYESLGLGSSRHCNTTRKELEAALRRLATEEH